MGRRGASILEPVGPPFSAMKSPDLNRLTTETGRILLVYSVFRGRFDAESAFLLQKPCINAFPEIARWTPIQASIRLNRL